ncbi:MAG: (2Fe-2S)-binding protein [Alphaproteobacteria bacterium]|nr:(2Fe-2S)-binding protein [Alphaproteobacteria bacterium SS10]
MFVCNCTGIGEKKLESLIDDEGAETVGQVFKAHGQRAQCGKCAADIRDILRDGPKSGATARESINEWRRRRLGADTRQTNSYKPGGR